VAVTSKYGIFRAISMMDICGTHCTELKVGQHLLKPLKMTWEVFFSMMLSLE
jgi:hypothetical protein